MDGLEWANKTGRTPLEIARLEGNTVLADVLSGMLNRRHNELHACFGDGAAQEAEQVRLLTCRPELAAQKDTNGSLPLHIAATAGASLAAVEECVRIFPDAPRIRNGDGFLPHQLALEHGHRILAEALATRDGKALPSKPPRTVLARAPVPLAGANETVEGSAPSTIVSTAAAEAPAAEPAQE